MTSSGYVWVEKYRPKIFEDIVLDPLNRQILKHYRNILFSQFAFLWSTWHWKNDNYNKSYKRISNQVKYEK